MSVYTAVSSQQLQGFLDLYSLGSLIEYSGIQAGIENTNYRVTSSKGDFILTVFESLSIQELADYLHLLNHLSQSNFPAPTPQLSKLSSFVNVLEGKPAAFFNCLPGCSIESPSESDCSKMGRSLAKLHGISQSSGFDKKNIKDLIACENTFNKIKHYLPNSDIELLSAELTFQLNYPMPSLPQGVIHADLFKDNVLFDQGSVSAVLDFYNACYDYYLFDIAVACNDWCVEKNTVNQQKIQAFLQGYQEIRPLTQNEAAHFIVFLRRAALRFWLSRLEHQLSPKQGELTLTKDPLIFRTILEQHKASWELL